MKTKTSELTDKALDFAVAKAKRWVNYPTDSVERGQWWHTGKKLGYEHNRIHADSFNPSTDWSHGGTIIEREGISIRFNHKQANCWEAFIWTPTQHDLTEVDSMEYNSYGLNPLIAAMRCFVASKLGDEVEVPKELT